MENWTKAQKEAIDSKGATLVTASAGTGKTAVLTEKVASIFLRGNVNIENVLVMTFSSAAAEEMKTRIGNKLMTMAQDPAQPLNVRRHLFSQIRKLHTANIKTIHAFCNDVIRKYYYEIGLNPDVEVGNTFDIAILKRKAISNVLENEYKKNSKEFISLIEYFDNSETIEDIFINAHEKIMNNINPMEWINQAISLYDVSLTEMPEYMKNYILNIFLEAQSIYDKVLMEIDVADDKKLNKAYDVCVDDLNIINKIIEGIKANNINIFDNNILDNFGATIRFSADYSYIKEMRNKAKNLIDSFKKSGFNIKEQLFRIRYMLPVVKKFTEIIVAFNDEYSKLKKEENLIDFSDMEQYSNQILDNPSISYFYKNKFFHVFVDEYQDTSPIQESIIEKISKKDNLFCVGDQKQSIYRFRSSEPTLFMDRDNAYRTNSKKGKVIALNNNFRSSKNILDCANDVFFRIAPQSKELVYNTESALIHGRNDSAEEINPVNVIVVPDGIKNELQGLSNDEIEIYNIVNFIKKKLTETVYDPEINDYRPVKYSDIVILCRKLAGYADSFVKIFNDNKIPFIVEKSGGLLSTVEIQNLINILNLSNDINNDLAIISFIHEGFFDFNDEDLISIRKIDFKNPLIENIKIMAEKDTDIAIKCKKFLDFFKSVNEKEQYLNLTALIQYILTSLNFMDYYAIQPNGKQKIANIKLFQQYVFNYDQKHTDKIFGFINYINDLKNTQIVIDEAKVNYDENSVRITTIHKSKGLEYSIVILPFMGKAFSSIDKRLNVNVERTVGLGFKYSNLEKEEKGSTLVRKIVDSTIADKSKEEEMRLLYVAMTRAKEELVIQGVASLDKNYSEQDDSNCMMDWILETVGFTEGHISSSLQGTWTSELMDSEAILPYVENKAKPVDPETFLARYSLNVSSENPVKKIRNAEIIPDSMSASLINQSEASPFNHPSFDSINTPAIIGTINHTFLKYLNFRDDLSYFGLQDQAYEMVDNGLLGADQIANIKFKEIESFFKTDIGKMIISADRVEKERSISILENATKVGFMNAEKEVLIRCVVDMMFLKDGEWYLLDYKTDNFNSYDEDSFNQELMSKIKKHKIQLDYYVKAIKTVYNINIKDSFLVFLNISKAYSTNV